MITGREEGKERRQHEIIISRHWGRKDRTQPAEVRAGLLGWDRRAAHSWGRETGKREMRRLQAGTGAFADERRGGGEGRDSSGERLLVRLPPEREGWKTNTARNPAPQNTQGKESDTD